MKHVPTFLALAILAAATLAGTGPAHAQRQSGKTGQMLAQLCTGDASGIDACDAYISGIADAAYFYQELRPADGSKGARLPGYICIPPAVTGTQLRGVVVEFTRKRADQAGRAAGGVVLRALDDAYHCPAR